MNDDYDDKHVRNFNIFNFLHSNKSDILRDIYTFYISDIK